MLESGRAVEVMVEQSAGVVGSHAPVPAALGVRDHGRTVEARTQAARFCDANLTPAVGAGRQLALKRRNDAGAAASARRAPAARAFVATNEQVQARLHRRRVYGGRV